MSAATDFLDAVDAYNEACDRVQRWLPRFEQLQREIERGTAGQAEWDSMVARFNKDVAVAEPLQERLFSGELSRAAAEEFPPKEVPPPSDERDALGRTVAEAAWGSVGPRLAQLTRDREALAMARSVVSSGPKTRS